MCKFESNIQSPSFTFRAGLEIKLDDVTKDTDAPLMAWTVSVTRCFALIQILAIGLQKKNKMQFQRASNIQSLLKRDCKHRANQAVFQFLIETSWLVHHVRPLQL